MSRNNSRDVQTSAPEAQTVQVLLIEIRALQCALATEIANLRADLRQRGVPHADDDQTALISAAHAACPSRAFIAAELLAAAMRADASGVRLTQLLRGRSIRAVGKALSGASNKRTGDGLVLRRVGNNSAGAIWCVTIE